ncbi:MAG: hypothetical protein ACJAZP_000888 [Psychromonas sp.]|uniref:hypothetical protein n=1 Tax=Psychromonas sp. TaxID=1884585 RepID=UPI0039E6020E
MLDHLQVKCLYNPEKYKRLLVLKRPEITINTNGSESDLIDDVKQRKMSTGIDSDLGENLLIKNMSKIKILNIIYLYDGHHCEPISSHSLNELIILIRTNSTQAYENPPIIAPEWCDVHQKGAVSIFNSFPCGVIHYFCITGVSNETPKVNVI